MIFTKTKNFYHASCTALVLSLLAACTTAPTTPAATKAADTLASTSAGTCEHDRAQLLALDMAQFDQNALGGWRALANQPGCLPAAADLIRDYNAAQAEKSYLLYWHEAQVRAISGDTTAATQLFEISYNTSNDDVAWNLYVDATIAFMRQDRTALVKAYHAMANLPVPASMQINQNGKSITDSWPPNMRVVEDLMACFGQQYRIAYQNCKS